MALISLNVNGQTYNNINVPDTSMPLLWVLRDLLGLTGTKYGCGIEVCGACTVNLNGSIVASCITLAGRTSSRRSSAP